MYIDYLHAYLTPLDMLCSQTMCRPKFFLCAFTIAVNPLITNDAIWRRLTLATCYQVGAIRFEDRGRWVGSPWRAVHMAAALAGERRALVGSGWTISRLALQTQNGCFNHSMVTLVADKLKKHW